MSTIFPVLSMDRSRVHWEDHLSALTPWEFKQGIWFKREDYFCPLGFHGPNGSKMRQLIWYVNRYRPGKTHIVTGASVQSPQLSMSAIVGNHFGLPCTQVVYSKPTTVLSHDNPRISAGFGARFDYAKGPYNPILQARTEHLANCDRDSLLVHYGITLPAELYSPEDLFEFHTQGAQQLDNVPPQVKTLIVPAGSCNSLTSVLLGLSQDPHNVTQLYTLGIGPDKRQWALGRLAYMGVDPSRFEFAWKHHSLHETGFSSYSEKFKGERYCGIDYHPTYEAKMWRYLRKHDPIERDGSTGFWIVGAEGKPSIVEPFFRPVPALEAEEN